MATVWERAMARERGIIESLPPHARLDLVMKAAAWTREALPEEHKKLLRRRVGATLERAERFVSSCMRGEMPSGRTFIKLFDKLDSYDDVPEYQELGRLFEGYRRAIDMAAGEATSDATADALEALYDAIRDAQRLPGSDLVVGDSLDAEEMASEACKAAIRRQKELVAAAESSAGGT